MRSSGPIAAAGSDPGRARENNEDRTLSDPAQGIFAVVDGVGGESGGEVAAQIAVDVLHARLSRRTTDLARLIREAVALANKRIWERAQAEPDLAGMSCVLTVAVLDGTKVTVGHVGDSRLYLLRRGEIRKLTNDHSPVGVREDAGEISETEAMTHPRRNEIFRDVGSAPHEPDDPGFVDILDFDWDPDTAFLICSDGLSDLVPAARVREIVEARAGRPDAAVRELIEAANEAGGKDNISVVLVEGERFGKAAGKGKAATAAVDPLENTQVTAPASSGSRPQLRGAGRAKPSIAERFGRLVFLLLVLGGLAFAGWYFREPLREALAGFGIGVPSAPAATVLYVDPQGTGGFLTIREALDAAEPGQTVEVAPGTYQGPLELRSGVSLVSRSPRLAILRLPQGTAEPAVTAEKVTNARFAGFLIQGNAQSPLEIGLRLADSSITVEDVEIVGAATAGLEVAGTDQSEVRESYVHDNPGTGVIVRDQAAPRLHQNLILRNGAGPEAPRPGVEIRDAARPRLVENRIEENAAAGVWVPAADRVDEVFGFNTFGTTPKEKAVRTPPRPGETPAPAPPARGGNRGPAGRSQTRGR